MHDSSALLSKLRTNTIGNKRDVIAAQPGQALNLSEHLTSSCHVPPAYDYEAIATSRV